MALTDFRHHSPFSQTVCRPMTNFSIKLAAPPPHQTSQESALNCFSRQLTAGGNEGSTRLHARANSLIVTDPGLTDPLKLLRLLKERKRGSVIPQSVKNQSIARHL